MTDPHDELDHLARETEGLERVRALSAQVRGGGT
jgi:hypothetical protein